MAFVIFLLSFSIWNRCCVVLVLWGALSIFFSKRQTISVSFNNYICNRAFVVYHKNLSYAYNSCSSRYLFRPSADWAVTDNLFFGWMLQQPKKKKPGEIAGPTSLQNIRSSGANGRKLVPFSQIKSFEQLLKNIDRFEVSTFKILTVYMVVMMTG